MPAAAFPHAYVELHIEQGPVLEDEGITIGVVTGVQGISWTEVTITGQSAHAGTTPMHLRHDALAVAARSIHEVRLIAGLHRCTAGGDRRQPRRRAEPRQRRPVECGVQHRPAQHRRSQR